MSTSRSTSRLAVRVAGASVLALSFGLAACSVDEDSDKNGSQSAATTTTSSSASSTDKASGDVSLDQGYVKSKTPDKAMTAIFGTLKNNTDKEKVLESVSSSDVKGNFELHTVVDGKMVEQKEGFKLPANGTLEMKPGGEHIMIMDNHDELAAGDKVNVQLKFKDGSTEKVSIPVREQPSGEENYGGEDSSDMSGMSDMPGMSDSAQPGGQEMGGQADHSMHGHSH